MRSSWSRSVEHFFITGLPRSRTLWLANYFSFGWSLCHHELTFEAIDRDMEFDGGEFRLRMLDNPCRYIGNSDSGMLPFWREIGDLFPHAPWLVVTRPENEVRASLAAAGIDQAGVAEMSRHLDDLMFSLQPLVVRFSDIDREIEQLERYLTPDAYYPDSRRRMLLRANATVTDRRVAEIKEHFTCRG